MNIFEKASERQNIWRLCVLSMWRVFILAGTYFVIICVYITVDVVGSVWVYISTKTYRLGICTCTLKGHESLM